MVQERAAKIMEEDDNDRTEEWPLQSKTLKLYDEAAALEAMMTELVRVKEEIDIAREISTQSWLDSKPLMDELCELQSELAKTKNRLAMSSVAVSELQSQLDFSITSIRLARKEESKARMAVVEISPLLDQTRIEVDKLKLELEEERREQQKMKQELHLWKLSLRTMQITQRAVRMESHALGASAAAAIHHIKYSKIDNNMIELSHEEYHKLTRKANELTALAGIRVSVSMEQKHAAEISRDKNLTRLKELYKEDRSRRDSLQLAIVTEETARIEGDLTSRKTHGKEIIIASIPTESPHVQVKENTKLSPVDRQPPRQSMKRSKSKNKKIVKKKKPSILQQIYSFLVRKITRFFG